MLIAARTVRVAVDIFKPSVRDIIKLIGWLRTEQDRSTMREVEAQEKALPKSDGFHSIQEVALAQIYDVQFADFQNLVRAKRVAVQERIDELKLEISQLQAEYNDYLLEQKKILSAVGSWEPPSMEEARNCAWSLYSKDSASTGKFPTPKSDSNLTKIGNQFASQVVNGFNIQHCRMSCVRDNLQGYLAEKIREFDRLRDDQQSHSFRIKYMAAFGNKFSLPLKNRLEEMRCVSIGKTPPARYGPEAEADRRAEKTM